MLFVHQICNAPMRISMSNVSQNNFAPVVMVLAMSVPCCLRAQENPAAVTRLWEPVPAIVQPGTQPGDPPSDAMILFDGTSLDAWTGLNGNPVRWSVENDVLTVVPRTGDIMTRDSFGDCQLHIEWRTPRVIEGEGQGRGNSGIFFIKRYEVQILDSYENATYPNGQAASIFKQHIPLVNVSRPPGQWQTYDIIFTAPRFNEHGRLKSQARMTVFHNGVVVHNNVALIGTTVDVGSPSVLPHGDHGPIVLQDHGNPVSFRNIWIRNL